MRASVGIGETDVHPFVSRVCVQSPGTHCMGLGLEEMLLGENPLEPEGLLEESLFGFEDEQIWNGRPGVTALRDGCQSIWPFGIQSGNLQDCPATHNQGDEREVH